MVGYLISAHERITDHAPVGNHNDTVLRIGQIPAKTKSLIGTSRCELEREWMTDQNVVPKQSANLMLIADDALVADSTHAATPSRGPQSDP